MANTARAKFQTTAPAECPPGYQNARKDFQDPTARPSGRSGGGEVRTPHRVSSSRRKAVKKASRRA